MEVRPVCNSVGILGLMSYGSCSLRMSQESDSKMPVIIGIAYFNKLEREDKLSVLTDEQKTILDETRRKIKEENIVDTSHYVLDAVLACYEHYLPSSSK